MQKNKCKITVYFKNPFWVGVCERFSSGKLSVCKITFGSEPKDYEVYDFLLTQWDTLVFSTPTNSTGFSDHKVNPKRMQREISKQLAGKGISTKAQLALQAQFEEGKTARKKMSRVEREAEKERRFLLRQKKAKKKHRGK